MTSPDHMRSQDHDPGAGDARVEGRSEAGPVRILCDEIGFEFDPRLERPEVLVAFVRELVGEVADMRHMQAAIAERMIAGKPPSEGSLTALNLAEGMLSVSGAPALMGGARLLLEACDRLNPEDTYPTDHLIDMLSSCACAIRFGLETPCRSRHAASAAGHIFKHKYGLSLFDGRTPAWEKEWARSVLLRALISLLPQSVDPAPRELNKMTQDNPNTELGRLEKEVAEHEDAAKRFLGYHSTSRANGEASAWDRRAREEMQAASDLRWAITAITALAGEKPQTDLRAKLREAQSVVELALDVGSACSINCDKCQRLLQDAIPAYNFLTHHISPAPPQRLEREVVVRILTEAAWSPTSGPVAWDDAKRAATKAQIEHVADAILVLSHPEPTGEDHG